MRKTSVVITLVLVCLIKVSAQESLLKGVEDSLPVREKISAAFKSTRVINAHSIEMLAKGNLDFRILHRFGRVNQGVSQLFGLDAASFRMAFDYGITNNLMIGIGRSTFMKELDGFLKARVFQQSRGDGAIPFSLVVAAGTMVWTEQVFTSVKPSATDRTSYYVQLIAGRKFSESFSLQLSPILLHRNMVERPVEENTIIALGGGARYKISKRVAFTVDYHHPLSGVLPVTHDPLSVGVDIETGGHVFQLQFSNSAGMNERAYLTETTDNFFNGDIHFGFNLSRIFKLGRKKA
jgi:hypothetical protein